MSAQCQQKLTGKGVFVVETLMSWHIINKFQHTAKSCEKFEFSLLSICVYILISVWLWNLKHGGS